MGRTEGQDAVPMTMWARSFMDSATRLDAAIDALVKSEAYLYEENMGATAIGTGITASPGYAENVQHPARGNHRKANASSKDLIAADIVKHAGFCDVFLQH